MGLLYLNSSTINQDSINFFTDSLSTKNTNNLLQNRPAVSIKNEYKIKYSDSTTFTTKKVTPHQNLIFDSTASVILNDSTIQLVQRDSIPVQKEQHNFFSFNLLSDSFEYKYNDVFFSKKDTQHTTELQFEKRIYHRSELNWALIIGLFSIFLLLFIKTYYQKFLEQVMNSFLNFQLADKMFKEKNILLRRAFFVLNLNFILIFSLLILLLLITFEFHITSKSYLDYLIILSSVIIALTVRYSIFQLSGSLFMQQPVILEYIHNKYLFNKNIGMALIPIVFTSIYVSSSISKILLLFSLVIIGLITILKILRGFQIFLKSGVLLFYTILYLCTLELLPLVLGSKLISTLR